MIESPWRSYGFTLRSSLFTIGNDLIKIISYPMGEFGCFLCCKSRKAVERTVDRFETPWRSSGFTTATMLYISTLITSMMIYYKWFRLQWESLEVSSAVRQGMLLSKPSSCRWFQTPWRYCKTIYPTETIKHAGWPHKTRRVVVMLL